MRLNIELDQGIGRGAIWTGDDRLPYEDPLNHLDRVLFHSELDYLRLVEVRQFTLTVPELLTSGSGQGSGGRNGLRVQEYSLGPHGVSGGTPFCIAWIVVNGFPVAFTGSVPVHQTTTDYYARWLAFGFDATNLYVHEYAVQAGNAGTQIWAARPAQTFDIYVAITNLLLA